MSMITMAVHDTVENNRTGLTERTLQCLLETVDWSKHRLFIIDNGSCARTTELYQGVYKKAASHNWCCLQLDTNIGTSRALNLAWQHRRAGEHVIKIDNDVVIHQAGWVEEMKAAIAKDNNIGIVGLKRKDIIQSPWHPDPNFRSELIMLPHEQGERWQVIERTNDIIGTCTMFNSALLDKVGYSYQPGLYGYEDVLFSHRSHLAGFYNCFLPHIEIDHIDPGAGPYQHWKEKHAGEHTQLMIDTFKAYVDGSRPIYEPFY